MALERNQLSQKVLYDWGLSFDLLRAKIDAANMQIALGKYDAVIATLNGVVQQTDIDIETQAVVYIWIGKAICNQEKFVDSKRCLQNAYGILEKKRDEVDLLEKLSQEQHSEGSVSQSLGWLLLLTTKVQESIPYLENTIGRLKDSFGPKSRIDPKVKTSTASVRIAINLIYLGNGVVNDVVDNNALVPFAQGMGLISDQLYEVVSNVCKENYYTPNSATCWDKLNKIDQRLGETDKPLPVRKRIFGCVWLYRAPGIVPSWPQIFNSENDDEIATSWLNNASVWKAIHVVAIKNIEFTQDARRMISFHKNLNLRGLTEIDHSLHPKNFGVDYVYNKEIMDVSLGPHHADLIDACQNLSKAYSARRSNTLAIEFQQRAIDAWESHGSSALEELTEARQVLVQLKEKAYGASC
ncbi:hypothetical protein ACFE04_022489 [Oxalis oulophora]